MKQIANSIEGNFCEKEIKKSEIICLKLLSYKLNLTTSFDFLEFFLKNGILFEDDKFKFEDLMQIYNETVLILKDFVNDMRYLDFTPLQTVCAIVSYVRKKNYMTSWNSHLEHTYQIKKEDFANCLFVIETIFSGKYYDPPIIESSLKFSGPKSPQSQSSLKYLKVPITSSEIHDEEEVRTPNNIINQRKPIHHYTHYNNTNFTCFTNDDMNSTMEDDCQFSFFKKIPIAFSTRKFSEKSCIKNDFSYNKNNNQSYVYKQHNSEFKSVISPFDLDCNYNSKYSKDIFGNRNINNNNYLYNYLLK